MKKIKMIDLFAGVGGFRLAFGSPNVECVLTSEIDPNAIQTYKANFKNDKLVGDITKVNVKDIPKHDLLCAGFPCQPFSIAGKRDGFQDTRGTLFFDIERIIKHHRPNAVLLENVKGLVNHDEGKTFKTILNQLEILGYDVYYKILNTYEYTDLPQNRERIFIVALHKQLKTTNFNWPNKTNQIHAISKILDPVEKIEQSLIYNQQSSIYNILKQSVLKENRVYQFRRRYVRENKKGVCPTLTANMGTGGHNVPIVIQETIIRKLSPRECFRLQGFPENFILPKIAKSHLYKQAGNSISVSLVKKIAKEILKIIQ